MSSHTPIYMLSKKLFKQSRFATDSLLKTVLSKKKSKISQYNNFNGNFSKILNKYQIKKYGGKKDLDFDGIINSKDCNPFSTMRQDFSPFRRQEKAEQMSAARRFGGQNLKGLKKIGQGRDRTVYALDKNKVLKVAKNPGGLTQNTSEKDLAWLDMGKQYEAGLDYVVMRKNQPLSKQGRQKLAQIRKQADDVPRQYRQPQVYDADLRAHLSSEDGALVKSGVGTDILNFNFLPGELFANKQWGEDKEGNLKLNDGGALQDNDSLKRFRVKDFQQVANIDRDKAPPWQLKDWNETQNQRRQFRDKGSYSKEQKFNRGFKEGDLIDFPVEREYYHGTSRKNAKQIAAQGLTPQGGDKTSEFTEDGYIYATPYKSYAESYARESFGDPVLLKTKQPVGLFNKEDRKWKGSIPADDIMITDKIPTVSEAYSANKNDNNFKQDYTPISNFFNDNNIDLPIQKKSYKPNPEMMEYFKQNPEIIKGNRPRGQCENAASCVAWDAVQQGVPQDKIKIHGVSAPNLKKQSVASHMVAEVDGQFIDPTKTQFGYDNDIISDSLDDKYYNDVAQPVDTFVQQGASLQQQDKWKNMSVNERNTEQNQSSKELMDINKDNESKNMTFIEDDGGRSKAGFKGLTGDCFVRAVAIVENKPYKDVYDESIDMFGNMAPMKGKYRGTGKSHPRTGVYRKHADEFLKDRGYTWNTTSGIGKGFQMHIKEDELPEGDNILRVSKHFVASKGKDWYDTYDSSREGTRGVYGYWHKDNEKTIVPDNTQGASLQKQNEWKNMSGEYRDIQRAQLADTDGDRIPDEYDCQPDNIMRQDTVYHGTTSLAAMKIKKQGILTSDELKAAGSPYHTLSEKTRPDKTYFFKDKPRAESWAEVATANSMFPNSSPMVVVADVPGDELFPDNLMETGGAFYKEGSVPASQILNTYEVERKHSLDDINAFRKATDVEIVKGPAVSDDGRKQMTTRSGSLMAKPKRDENGQMI